MSVLKDSMAATERKLKDLKDARKATNKERLKEHKQSKAERERKLMLIDSAVLARVQCSEWDEADFLNMMDAALFRPADKERLIMAG